MKRIAGGICLALIFSLRLAAPAMAMPCDNKGASDRLHYGSTVAGEKVTICAEYWWPVTNLKPKTSTGTSSSKPVVPLAFTVTPERPVFFTNHQRNVSVGEAFDAQTTAKVHARKGTLLGRKALVRFVPILTIWNFGDGKKAISDFALHSFKTTGSFDVSALVRYSVFFRFIGATKWIADPRPIELPTNKLRFKVTKAVSPVALGKPLLVWKNCLETKRLGC